jgi:sulfite reductase (NADPH) hemoprotein beta-component
VIAVIEHIVVIQRDFGNRENRKTARLKYTVDRQGLDWFKKEIESRSGITFEKERPYEFIHNSDKFGWTEDVDGNWFYTLFVENGRVKDQEDKQMKKCLAEIARLQISDFRLTGNQNLIFGNVSIKNKPILQSVLDRYNTGNKNISPLRLNSLACVAMNTCPLAFAEAETYLPKLIDRIDELTKDHGISQEAISIRMTGCPNGCARPYNAEIAFVGRAPGIYNMYLGGNRDGSRLNRLYKEMLKEEDILKELGIIFADFATHNNQQLGFGDFVWENAYVTRDIPLTL